MLLSEQDSSFEPHSPSSNSLPSSRWKARLSVSIIMLGLAFITLLVMKIHPRAYWLFTCIMAGIDAILCIGLVWFIKRQNPNAFAINIWHMVLHWLGFIATIYLITVFIRHGVITEVDAGLFSLIILALTLYLAGIYTDTIFILIGITLAILATGTILLKAYLWLIMIPIIVIAALIIFAIVHRDRHS